jgi:hypothetical protein
MNQRCHLGPFCLLCWHIAPSTIAMVLPEGSTPNSHIKQESIASLQHPPLCILQVSNWVCFHWSGVRDMFVAFPLLLDPPLCFVTIHGLPKFILHLCSLLLQLFWFLSCVWMIKKDLDTRSFLFSQPDSWCDSTSCCWPQKESCSILMGLISSNDTPCWYRVRSHSCFTIPKTMAWLAVTSNTGPILDPSDSILGASPYLKRSSDAAHSARCMCLTGWPICSSNCHQWFYPRRDHRRSFLLLRSAVFPFFNSVGGKLGMGTYTYIEYRPRI